MKFLRFGDMGAERPGVMGDDGKIRDISGLLQDIDPAAFASGVLERLDPAAVMACPEVPDGTRLAAPVARTGNFLAIGLNYVQHALETNSPIPEEPILFNKASSCISGPHDPVLLPPGSEKLDWEVELAFVIGKRAFRVTEEESLAHVFGYMVCNDVSERHFQLERGGLWTKGKCYPTHGPLGPYLVTSDEVGDPQSLGLWLEVNGERLQNSNTDDMIFPVAKIVSYLSQFLVLEPGDIVTTGTPQGVGLGMVPERFLRAGDVMALGIDKLGTQRQTVTPLEG